MVGGGGEEECTVLRFEPILGVELGLSAVMLQFWCQVHCSAVGQLYRATGRAVGLRHAAVLVSSALQCSRSAVQGDGLRHNTAFVRCGWTQQVQGGVQR
jgi:hypothetical protein